MAPSVAAASDVLILGYHGLSQRWSSSLAVRPDWFEWQVALLRDRGYQGVTFDRAMNDPPQGRCVAITFDDAYRSVLEFAYPILRRFEMPGTVYAPTDHMSAERAMSWDGIERWIGTPDEDELMPMSWDELGELADAGWEIGSHTCSHPRLTRIGEAQLVAELQQSRALCEEKLGRACRTIAYPYGDVDRRVIEATKSAGYLAAASIVPVPVRPFSSFNWPRTGIYLGDHRRRFSFKITRPGRMLHSSDMWRTVSRARGVLRRGAPTGSAGDAAGGAAGSDVGG
jgi:peptidoglycan/xylan/chitin deacetylase (PgdA/CDA1 family)